MSCWGRAHLSYSVPLEKCGDISHICLENANPRGLWMWRRGGTLEKLFKDPRVGGLRRALPYPEHTSAPYVNSASFWHCKKVLCGSPTSRPQPGAKVVGSCLCTRGSLVHQPFETIQRRRLSVQATKDSDHLKLLVSSSTSTWERLGRTGRKCSWYKWKVSTTGPA